MQPDFRVSRHLTLLDAGGHADISRDEAQKIMTQISRGEIWSGEFDVRGRANAPFRVAVTDLPLVDSLRQIVGVVGISSLHTGLVSIVDVLQKARGAVERLWPSEPHLPQRTR